MALDYTPAAQGVYGEANGQQLLSEFSLQKLDCKPLLLRR